MINRTAAYLTGSHGMAHVELRFRCGESVSVFNGETVFLKKRGYSNTQYKIVALSVDAESERRMYNFARNQVGKLFNTWGLRRALLPWPFYRSTDGHLQSGSWFCSELVIRILQEAGLLLQEVAEQSSPNGLYALAYASASGQGVRGGLKTSLAANQLALQEKTNSLQFGLGQKTGAAKAPDKSKQATIPPLSISWTRQLEVRNTNTRIQPTAKVGSSSWTSALVMP